MGSVGGTALFGYCLNVFLYGILIVQTYLYYLAFPNDRRPTKIIVYFAFTIETLQTAFALRDFHLLYSTSKGSLMMESPNFDIRRFGFMLFTIPISGVCVATTVQLFYAQRIYVISKAKWATMIVALLSFVQFISGIVSAVFAFRPGKNPGNSSLGYGAVALMGIAGAACDGIITIFMTYWLSRQLGDASKCTQALVTKIMRLLFETGVLTAGVAILHAVLTVSKSVEPRWFMIPGLSVGKLYASSMLVLLNNRFVIVGGRVSLPPECEGPIYPQTGANARPASLRDITFTHNHPRETTLSINEIPALDFDPESKPEFGESKETKEGTKESTDLRAFEAAL